MWRKCMEYIEEQEEQIAWIFVLMGFFNQRLVKHLKRKIENYFYFPLLCVVL